MGLKNKLKKFLKIFQRKNIMYANITYKNANELLKDEFILVTGGSSGIGLSIAKKCVSEGAKVVITGKNEEKLKKTVKEIGNNCSYVVNDVSNIDSFDNLLENLESKFGKLTALVNNAGIYSFKDFKDINEDDFDTMFNVNTKGSYFLSQKVTNYFIKNKISGKIVFVTSNRAYFGDIVPYGMSKAAIRNFVSGLAKYAIKNDIRVNAVAPGITASNINHIDVKGNLYDSGVRNKRVLLPDEIAEVVTFLLSKNSNCIVGQTIMCDEGDSIL